MFLLLDDDQQSRNMFISTSCSWLYSFTFLFFCTVKLKLRNSDEFKYLRQAVQLLSIDGVDDAAEFRIVVILIYLFSLHFIPFMFLLCELRLTRPYIICLKYRMVWILFLLVRKTKTKIVRSRCWLMSYG